MSHRWTGPAMLLHILLDLVLVLGGLAWLVFATVSTYQLVIEKEWAMVVVCSPAMFVGGILLTYIFSRLLLWQVGELWEYLIKDSEQIGRAMTAVGYREKEEPQPLPDGLCREEIRAT